MSDDVEYQGLCSTCNHAPTCVRLKHQKGPIWFCEEFDNYVSPPKRKVSEDVSQLKEKTYDRSMGLCCNCKNRETCTFPKPEGGIWHCEEYQ
jgi:hypothetical protein